MDQNTDSPNNAPENHPPQTPPSEYDTSAPPIPAQPATQTPLPATEELSKDAKMWATFCQLSALAMFTSIPFANVIGPLIVWLIKKDDFKFVDDQGKEALNFQISIALYALLCIPLFFIFVGFFLFVAVGVFDLVMIIIASIETNKGNPYRYPLCIRLIK